MKEKNLESKHDCMVISSALHQKQILFIGCLFTIKIIYSTDLLHSFQPEISCEDQYQFNIQESYFILCISQYSHFNLVNHSPVPDVKKCLEHHFVNNTFSPGNIMELNFLKLQM